MSSNADLVDAIIGPLPASLGLTAKKMFGEYGLFVSGKMVAMVCDDQLFVRPTPASQAFYPEAETAPPYPQSKPHLLIPEDRWEDSAWLAELLRLTEQDMPAPKPKKPRL